MRHNRCALGADRGSESCCEFPCYILTFPIQRFRSEVEWPYDEPRGSAVRDTPRCPRHSGMPPCGTRL
jgi:hypothetical protein